MPGVSGRVVLVSGASRGIGAAATRLFLSGGAKVMAISRSEKDLAATGFPHYYASDLSTKEGCRAAVDATERTLGPVDILICNHGVGSAAEVPLQETSVERWKHSMAINLDGPFYLTRLVLPGMVERGYGRCVYTSSTAATEAEPSAVGYNTSKAGLLGLMRSVCQDGGPYGVTANAVLPGWVKTEMADQSAEAEAKKKGTTKEEIWKERASLYPAKRVVSPEEVAQTILFLASEESSGVSGESIRVSLGCPY